MQDSQPDSNQKSVFVGEEDVEGRSTPRKDLTAAVTIAVFSVVAMVLALQLDIPDTLFTAPGLLPFITGLTLLCMVGGLGLQAVKRGALDNRSGGPSDAGAAKTPDQAEEQRRLFVLIGIIIGYIILVDVITFDLRFPVADFALHFSSFELVSIPVLAFVLRIFWKRPWTQCAMVAVPVVIGLASIFRYGFSIPLPGAG